MNYAKINKTDIANGVGVRVSLFVSGCDIRCPGCFNVEAWNYDYGEPFTDDTIAEIIEALEPEHIAGLSVLGGEPLSYRNIVDVKKLLCAVKAKYPHKSIWLYTGYTYERFRDDPILNYVDVLVDGAFVEAQRDITLNFRGSSNQRIIDVGISRETGKVFVLNRFIDGE